jgi:hypothetical protein
MIMRPDIFWVEGPWRARLPELPRPRGADWLADEIKAWHRAGIQVIVSALTKEEETELELTREADLCKSHRIEYLAFPVADRGVPASVRATTELVRQLEKKLGEGENVAIHCRQGLAGRPCWPHAFWQRRASMPPSLLTVFGWHAAAACRIQPNSASGFAASRLACNRPA